MIERELGRGGMGVVFAARHAILGHRAALKILHAELSQREDVVQRFFNEARAAAAINHPGIVRVHDVGVVGDAAFLVMDLLAGESLAERLRARGPLTVPVAVAVTRQIALALAAAHAAGIVHRDLKPDNIFLVDDPRSLHVVLLDFGVAKLTGALQSGDLRTKTGALLGTPYYMSPEQCDGEREIDLRSDLYSLGCMMFQMVSGKLPFEGGLGAVIGAHLHVAAPSLRMVLPTAPPAIEAIVAQLMAKDPGERFSSATALVGALDTWSPTHDDHVAIVPRTFDMGIAETLPMAISSNETVDTVPPSSERASRARPSIKPPEKPRPEPNDADTVRDAPRSSRRGVLAIAAAFGLVGIAVTVWAVTRSRGGSAPIDAAIAQVEIDAVVATADAALADAPGVDDAAIAGNRIDAPAARADARTRDATAVARADASVDATELAQADAPAPASSPKETAILKRLDVLSRSTEDWEASRAFMLLEVEAPNDPRLGAARQEAKRLIQKFGRDDDRKAIHRALVDHQWAKGLEKCLEWGDVPRVDIVVQCTVLACIGKDDVKMERWGGGVPSGPLLEAMAKFCSRYRAP